MSKKNINYLNLIYKVILIIISSILFYFSNPNPIIKEGLSFLAWIYYFPVLLLVNDCNFKNCWIIGGLYGCLSYALYGAWLNSFHPLGLIIICIFYFIIFAFIFFILKSIEYLFPRNFWIVDLLLLCSYEYIKILGFAGFSYGVTAYTQWKNIYFIQITQIIGVFGLNILIIYPSVFLFGLVTCRQSKNMRVLSISVWAILIVFSYIFGFNNINRNNKESFSTVKVVAVQNNEDPWKNGIKEYSKNIQTLKYLTEEAMELYPDISYVLWPETAVVPSVMYQFYKLVDEERFNTVYSLLNYIDSKNSVFVIGNSHEEENKKRDTDRYNSALVFFPGENVMPPEPEMYSKIHLVPFTETFPYKYIFPNLYIKLLNGDTHMWTPGNEYKVFKKDNFSFATPICFEDTFGNDCRNFVLNGARCFFNMSNDAWSKSRSCQYQHLAMAVFRSVENQIPTVRSTSSGQTCIINQTGKIINIIPEFCESYVVGDIPVLSSDNFKLSFYTKYGDIFGIAECILFLCLLIIQIFHVIIKLVANKFDKA